MSLLIQIIIGSGAILSLFGYFYLKGRRDKKNQLETKRLLESVKISKKTQKLDNELSLNSDNSIRKRVRRYIIKQ